jgi:hypothetical protein
MDAQVVDSLPLYKDFLALSLAPWCNTKTNSLLLADFLEKLPV